MSVRRSKLDRIDAEAVEVTLATDGWKLIEARIRAELDRRCRELQNDQPELSTVGLRGRIHALQTVLEIPAILIREGKEQSDAGVSRT